MLLILPPKNWGWDGIFGPRLFKLVETREAFENFNVVVIVEFLAGAWKAAS